MTKCYVCNNEFYGKKCPKCDWYAIYKCWNCYNEVSAEFDEKCDICGWFICDNCNSCGCDKFRPNSNKEKEVIM